MQEGEARSEVMLDNIECALREKVTLFAHKVNLFIWQILTRHMYIQGVFLCQQLKSF